MNSIEKELKLLSEQLAKLQKEGQLEGYSLIGALALAAHARPRATQDIDFLVSADKDFFFKVLPETLKKKGYKLKVFKGALDDPINGLIRIYDQNNESEIADIIPVFWKWQDEIVKQAERIELFNVSIPVARVEDLIVLKLKAGGPQDMLDVEELLNTAKITKKIDLGRLRVLSERAKVSKKLNQVAAKLNFSLKYF
ncbi:MAG: DUF6036 family nucleotidyltransferase [bacterium]